VTFQRFVLTDADENYEPPEKPVLDLTVISGTAFLRIGKQATKGAAITEDAQIAVHVDDLYDALGAAYRGDLRARARAASVPSEGTDR
jgi:hypothetical protein